MLERLRQLHFSWIYFVSILTLVSYLFLLTNTAHPDLWGHMAFGALYEYNDFQFPYIDVFAYTVSNATMYDHEWGAGTLFYFLAKNWGSASLFFLLVTLYALVLLLPLFLILKALKQTVSSSAEKMFKELTFVVFFPILALLMCTLYIPTLWAHNFTFLFYVLFLTVLEYCRTTKRYNLLFVLPFLSLLWVNIHGGFVVGFCVVGIYFLDSIFKALSFKEEKEEEKEAGSRWGLPKCLALVLFLCAVTVFLTPYGVDYLRQIWTFWFLDRSGVADWDSVFSSVLPPFQPFYGLLYGLCYAFWLALALFDWKKQGFKTFPWRLLLIGATGYEGMIHYKLVPLFVITVLSLGFQLRVPSRFKTPFFGAVKKRFNAIVYYILPLSLLISSTYMCTSYVLSHPKPFAVKVSDSRGMGYPIGAMNYLKENKIKGNLWSTFIWGEFLYWNLYPNMKIAMDGRFETVYPMAVFEEFMQFAEPPHDFEIPLKYGTTHLLVPNAEANHSFFEAVKKTDLWHEIYRDPNAVLYSINKLGAGQSIEENKDFAPLMTLDDSFVGLEKFRLKKQLEN